MRSRGSARPTVGAERRAMEPEVTSHENPGPTLECTTTADAGQMLISDFLLRGAENAIPLRHLKQLTGLSGRDVRSMRNRAKEIEVVAAAVEGADIDWT